MTRNDDAMGEPAGFAADRAFWQRCRTIEVPENQAERFLDLAGLADGLLDDGDERDRVAAIVAADPVTAADVAAARAVAASGVAMPGGIERILERAIAIADKAGEPGDVVAFAPRTSVRRVWQDAAQWGSLAAAIAIASWLGFAMGSGASLSLTRPGQQSQISDDSFLPELLDPSTGFLRDLGEGQQT